MKLQDLTPLFIFELANNHAGSVEHGLRIIREVRAVTRDFPWRFAFKFQYRDLDTFIHPAHRDSQAKYVRRFQETRLSVDDLRRLKGEVDEQGFVSICTPFDEPSVDLIEAHGFDILKVASCSFTDWPLLERMVQSSKPIIASAAGQPLENIDNVVSFFQHRQKNLALMHCVAAYPTPPQQLALNQIDLFRTRYTNVPIGYSTHEPPDELRAVAIAVAKGAQLFEKHVDVARPGGAINAYSATPQQVRAWLEAAREAFTMCGPQGRRHDFSVSELASLRGLRRGAFARRELPKGHTVRPADLMLAIPTQDGQLTANDLSKYTDYVTLEPIPAGEALLADRLRPVNKREKVELIIGEIRRVLAESRQSLPQRTELEISHHYGIDRFEEFGIAIVQIVNREYCKKLLVMLPGQVHPEQYHQTKEETFHIVHGEAVISLDGIERTCRAGDVVVVERGTRHMMRAITAVIIEEISTTHLTHDSFYSDPTITASTDRKTLVTHWMN